MSSPSQRTSSLVQPIGLMPRRIMIFPVLAPVLSGAGSDHGGRGSSSSGALLAELRTDDVAELLQPRLDTLELDRGEAEAEGVARRRRAEKMDVAGLDQDTRAGGAALGLAGIELGRSLDPVGG